MVSNIAMQLMRFAHGPETVRLGDLEVRRLGFGAMRLVGKDAWGESEDPATAHAVLRRAVELGVQLIDTSLHYGPASVDRLIVEALHPYPADLVLVTKIGVVRGTDRSWLPALGADDMRAAVEAELRSLRLDVLPVVQLRWTPQRGVAFAEALDTVIALRAAGKLRHVALGGDVSAELLAQALGKLPIVAVESVLEPALVAACEQRGIAVMPVFPMSARATASTSGTLAAAARRNNCSPPQLVIASLLAQSPLMVPMPGTSKVVHLEENVGAVHVALDAQTVAQLAA